MRRVYCFVVLFLLLSSITVLGRQETEAKKETDAQSQAAESDAFRSAVQIKEPAQRLDALNKFLGSYPNSLLKPVVKFYLFKAMVENGAGEKDYLPVAEEAITTFPEIPQKVIVLNEVAFTLAEAEKVLDLALKYAELALTKYAVESQK